MSKVAHAASGSVEVTPSGDKAVRITLRGQLSSVTAGELWREIDLKVPRKNGINITIDAGGVDFCDCSGVGLIVDLKRQVEPTGGSLTVEGLSEESQKILDLFDSKNFEQPPSIEKKPTPLAEEVGEATFQVLKSAKSHVVFIGEITAAMFAAIRNPRLVRWKDTIRIAETAGADALPIVLLVGFLIGLIMAFQAAIPMKQFGADIFVADLVALSMLRELGPLMTAIVLAGRSSTAFAAEIGTMKVNEEINALETMGLQPVSFLAIPRVIAAVSMTPILTVFANVAGLVGGLIVMLSLGYPVVTYINQVGASTDAMDFIGGMIKAFMFGILIAGIGCMSGLETKAGASAVGVSTTRAVVSCIVMISVMDGIFSVLYYSLGI